MKKIKFTTAGESHGELLLGIIEGIPSNLEITEEYIYKQLKRRQMGFGRGKRMKIESDKPHICSGVRLGKTLGSPIGLIIKNNDWDNWKKKMNVNFTDIKIRGKSILKVDCQKSEHQVYVDNLQTYLRMGPSTNLLEGPELVKFAKERFN